MSVTESERINQAATWYKSEQLEIDKQLLVRRYQSIKPFFRGATCLELGPAEGIMTSLLVQDFGSVTVVDGSKELLDMIPPATNLEKVLGLFEEFRPSRRYDTIVVDHVLEHVEDPVSLVRAALSWLAEGGRLIVGVPNADSLHRLAAVKLGMLPHQAALNERDITLGHRRVYSPESLADDLREAGARIIHSGGVFLKVLSNKQLQAQWPAELIAAYMELGVQYPQISAEIFSVCERSSTC